MITFLSFDSTSCSVCLMTSVMAMEGAQYMFVELIGKEMNWKEHSLLPTSLWLVLMLLFSRALLKAISAGDRP